MKAMRIMFGMLLMAFCVVAIQPSLALAQTDETKATGTENAMEKGKGKKKGLHKKHEKHMKKHGKKAAEKPAETPVVK